jgi:hypothetical protein
MGWKFTPLILPDIRSGDPFNSTPWAAGQHFNSAEIDAISQGLLVRGAPVSSYPWGSKTMGTLRAFRESIMEQAVVAIKEFYPLTAYRIFDYNIAPRANGYDFYECDGAIDVCWRVANGIKLTTSLVLSWYWYNQAPSYDMMPYIDGTETSVSWRALLPVATNQFPPGPGNQLKGELNWGYQSLINQFFCPYGSTTYYKTRFVGWIGVHPTDGILLHSRGVTYTSSPSTNISSGILGSSVLVSSPHPSLDTFIDWPRFAQVGEGCADRVYMLLYHYSYSYMKIFFSYLDGNGSIFPTPGGLYSQPPLIGKLVQTNFALGDPSWAIMNIDGCPFNFLVSSGDSSKIDYYFSANVSNPEVNISWGGVPTVENALGGLSAYNDRWQWVDSSGCNWLVCRYPAFAFRQQAGADLHADAVTMGAYNYLPFT